MKDRLENLIELCKLNVRSKNYKLHHQEDDNNWFDIYARFVINDNPPVEIKFEYSFGEGYHNTYISLVIFFEDMKNHSEKIIKKLKGFILACGFTEEEFCKILDDILLKLV